MTDENFVPIPLRPAATLILVREKNNSLEVYLLKRSTKSGFMGGLYVFPGGTVEHEDMGVDFWASHIDLPLNLLEKHLGIDTLSMENTLGFSIAVIRETLEEAGVFMASGQNKTKNDFSDISRFRLNLNLPKSWFKTKIKTENWILSLSSLGCWSHWITPELMKKRFDTFFFIAVMPQGQTCAPDNSETADGIWISPQKALKKNLEAKIPLSPPTIVTLTQLLDFVSLDSLAPEIKNRTWGTPVCPRLIKSGVGPVIIEPWDPMYERENTINISGLSQKVLPPGSSFSRIWCDNGLWKPVDR